MGVVPVINGAAFVIERIASVFLAGITLLIFLSALARYLFASPIPDAHAVSSLVLGIAVLWGLACVTWRDDHIAVDIVWLAMPARIRQIMDVLGLVLLLVFIALFAWKLLQRIDSVMDSQQYTVDLRLSLWPFYLTAWLGVLSALVMGLARLWLTLFNPRALPSRSGVLDLEEEPR